MAKKHITYTKGIVYHPILIDAVTVTTSSIVQLIAGARAVGIEFFSSVAGSTPGQDRAGNLVITVSMDGGTNFRAYNMLIKNIVADAGAGTAGEDIGHTRVAASLLTAGSAQSEILWLDPATVPGLTHIKATFTRTTTGTKGTFTARAVITY